MDNLELLNDAELRRRLIQYGFPNLPVTTTTRNILIKKLRNYMENEQMKLRRETSYATRYSSDEDLSDKDKPKRKGRSTITASNAMPPPTNFTRRTVAAPPTKNKSSPSPKRSSIYVPPPIHYQQEQINHHNYQDTDEESDQNSTAELLNTSPTSSFTSSLHSNFSHRSRSNNASPLSRSPQMNTSYISPATNQQQQTNGHTTEHSPYLSDFTKRLLNLRGTTVTDSSVRRPEPARTPSTQRVSMPQRYFNDSSMIGGGSGPDKPITYTYKSDLQNDRAKDRPFNKEIPISKAFSNFLHKVDEQYAVTQTIVPYLLLGALAIFFLLVAFVYINKSPDLAARMSLAETKYNLCHPANLQEHMTCINEYDIEPSLQLLKSTEIELQKRAEHHKCVDSSVPYTINAKEVVNSALSKDHTQHVHTILNNLHNMEYLIHMNPQWHIQQCDISGNPLTFNEISKLRNTQGNYFALENPRLPWSCTLYNKFQRGFVIVGSIGIGCIIMYACYFAVNYILDYRKTRKETVNKLITDIINALMERAISEPGNPSASLVVISHLRDKLIAPAHRASMEWAWEAAISFLENNESRIQFELGNRSGEDCRMMRWVDTIANSTLPHSGARTSVKKWQSPAFDTNKIKEPPTECLKIRQMFDAYESSNPNLKQIIQDSILEKCGNKCKIYDIQMDTVNCFVYVRCATSADAGIVHDQINGWWFDSRLVSIKFLRLERYLTRFPNSPSGPSCLRPSNTKNLSMTNCNEEKLVNGSADDGIGEDD